MPQPQYQLPQFLDSALASSRLLQLCAGSMVPRLARVTIHLELDQHDPDSDFYFRHTNMHNAISSTHRRDNTMAALLSGIVVVFILCHTTKVIIRVFFV